MRAQLAAASQQALAPNPNPNPNPHPHPSPNPHPNPNPSPNPNPNLTQARKVAEIYRAILKLAFVVDIGRCNVSAEAADLIRRLLVVEPRARLADAPSVKAQPFFRGVNWQSHAQPVAAGRGPSSQGVVPTARGLAARSVPFGAKGAAAPSSASEASAMSAMSTERASDVGALAGGDAAAGSKSSDSKSSDGGGTVGSVLSAASTIDFHTKNQAHLDNLTGLNDMIGAKTLGGVSEGGEAEAWAEGAALGGVRQ